MAKRHCCVSLLRCLCFPVILLYHAFRIYCCECIAVLFGACWQHLAYCCCCCFEVLCCACCGCRRRFVDSDFPPCAQSLGKTKQDSGNIEWIRLEDLFSAAPEGQPPQRAQLFHAGVEPSDVHQGGLGDCWLMSSIAALAEFPAVIKNLFITKRYSTYGKYTLRLFDCMKDKWVEVYVDDLVPCSGGTPVFAQPQNTEMWAVLIEKAVAKFCGSYGNISGGLPCWALATLTGMPTFSIGPVDEHRRTWARYNLTFTESENHRGLRLFKTDEEYSLEKLFFIIREYNEKKCIMCASTEGGDDTKNRNGIVLGHAYTLQGAAKYDDFMLVQLRNPWGHGEWQGDWSDDSSMWTKYPGARSALNYESKSDGSFWMTIQDFATYFDTVDICARSTGFEDLALDVHEECGICGVCIGCCCGCLSYWCCCRGCGAMLYGEEADEQTVKGKKYCCE